MRFGKPYPRAIRSVAIAVLTLTAANARASHEEKGGLGGSDGSTRFAATLDGFQETPAIITPGNGTFDLTINDNSTLDYTLTFSDLDAPATVAHIHIAQRGVAGGIVAFLCGGGGKPDCPAAGGTVTGTITAADILPLVAQGVQAGQIDRVIIAIRAGVTYANVHSTLHPAGEIRGQIKALRNCE